LEPRADLSAALVRHGFDPVAYCAPLSSKTLFQTKADLLRMFWRKVAVEAVSASGIALFAKFKVEPGAYLAVELRCASLGLSRTLLARVASIAPRTDEGWTTTCAFDDPSSFEKLNEER